MEALNDMDIIISESPYYPLDSRLLEAARKAEETNQITPILKEELRTRIMLQRLERGEPAINTQADEPIDYELTPEEIEKKERRRQQNREAARRCRIRKRKIKENVMKELEKMESNREKLENEVAALKREKLELESKLRNHTLLCCCPFGPGLRGYSSFLERSQSRV